MPIRAEMRWFYPIDWPQLRARHRLRPARHNLSLADHRDGLEVKGVEGLAGRRLGFGEMLLRALRDARVSLPWTPGTTATQPPVWVAIGR
jgi:hypothetical protein